MFKKAKPSFPKRIPRQLAELKPKQKKSPNKRNAIVATTAIGIGAAVVGALVESKKAKKA